MKQGATPSTLFNRAELWWQRRNWKAQNEVVFVPKPNRTIKHSLVTTSTSKTEPWRCTMRTHPSTLTTFILEISESETFLQYKPDFKYRPSSLCCSVFNKLKWIYLEKWFHGLNIRTTFMSSIMPVWSTEHHWLHQTSCLISFYICVTAPDPINIIPSICWCQEVKLMCIIWYFLFMLWQ